MDTGVCTSGVSCRAMVCSFGWLQRGTVCCSSACAVPDGTQKTGSGEIQETEFSEIKGTETSEIQSPVRYRSQSPVR